MDLLYAKWYSMSTYLVLKTRLYIYDNLLKALAELGYPCDMEIVNNIDNEEYPKEGTYILISKNRQILLDSDE